MQMISHISGPAANALGSLSSDQLAFIRALPKAELHAHLNGCIPIAELQQMASEYARTSGTGSGVLSSDIVQDGITKLENGVTIDEVHDFFGLFPAIYALTATPTALRRVARAVLSQFLDGVHPQCAYLELRSTPRETPEMTRLEYVKAVLDEVEQYPVAKAGFILSIDRRMSADVVRECINIACQVKTAGRRIVGVDLCGDPTVLAGEIDIFAQYLSAAQEAGLCITVHIAETLANTAEETRRLLSHSPNRLGHATFLDEAAKAEVLSKKTCIEMCLSSNILCKTVSRLEDHHIRYYLQHDHPVAICTDDTLPFRTSLEAEYALLLAAPPLGLGLCQDEVRRIAEMGMAARFGHGVV